MKKVILSLAIVLASGGAAQAANTLTLTNCGSSSATATWNVDSGAASKWLEVVGVSDNTSIHIYDLGENSGSVSLDWAATVGDSSNTNLSMKLNDGSTTVSASCS